MKIPIYQVDAFADAVFRGNPAAVCPLEHWLPDETLQAIAEENNLSETAFMIENDGAYHLRWFTPTCEVELCGHATIATAHVLFEQLRYSGEEILFNSHSGPLKVRRDGNHLSLDFPSLPGESCDIPSCIEGALGRYPRAFYRSMDYMAVFDKEEDIREMDPDFEILRKLDARGLIVTAPGRESDFVCRFFAPNYGINEDPVTGSAYCTLTPYWSAEAGKKRLAARQLSKRTGSLICELAGDRVLVSGRAVLYMEGYIEI